MFNFNSAKIIVLLYSAAKNRKSDLRHTCIILLVGVLLLAFGCDKDPTPSEVAIPVAGFPSYSILAPKAKDLEQSLNSNPSDAEKQVRLAFVYLDMAGKPEGKEGRRELADKARALFEQAIAADTTNRDALIGLELIKGIKHSEKAVGNLVRQIEKKPAQPIPTEEETLSAYNHLITALMYTQSETGARKAVTLSEVILKKHSEDMTANLNMAKLLFGEGELNQAKRYAQQVVAHAPENDTTHSVNEAHNLLGQIYNRFGMHDKSEEHFLLAAKVHEGKQWACAYQSLGGLYKDLGRPNDAVKMDMKYSDMIPENADEAFRAAFSCFNVGDFANAIKYTDRALKYDPSPKHLALKGYLFLFEQKYDQAKRIFEDILASNPNDPGALVGMGHLDVANKNYEAAEARLKSVTENLGAVPDVVFVAACLGMGWANANRNRHSEAITYFNRAIKLYSDEFLALLGKGNSQIGLGRYDQAAATLERALKLQPDNPYATAELAMIRLQKGENDKAEEGFKKALARDDKNYTCPYEGLGLLYMKQGKTDLAKKNFEKSIEINPDIEYKKYNGLAKIYIKEGKTDKARKLLEKSIRNFPWDDEAKNMLDQLNHKKTSGVVKEGDKPPA